MTSPIVVNNGGVKGIFREANGEKELDRQFPAGTCWERVVFQPQAPDDGTFKLLNMKIISAPLQLCA